MPSAREDDLLTSILELLTQKAIQLDSTDPKLDDEFMQTVDASIELFQTGDVPRDCLSLFRLVERLKAEWDEFDMYVSIKQPRPRAGFWKILDEIENELTFAPPNVNDAPVESLELLKEQNVREHQICTIYSHEGKGPFMKNGLPQPHLLRQEMEKPGSVLGKDFEHPRVTAERERLAKYRNPIAVRANELRGEIASRSPVERDADDVTGVGPGSSSAPIGSETLEELILSEVPDKQIVKIKGCTYEEIGQAKLRIKAAAKEGQSPAELADLTAQILEWKGANPDAKNQEIAEVLGCEVKLVSSVLRKAKEHKAEGATA